MSLCSLITLVVLGCMGKTTIFSLESSERAESMFDNLGILSVFSAR